MEALVKKLFHFPTAYIEKEKILLLRPLTNFYDCKLLQFFTIRMFGEGVTLPPEGRDQFDRNQRRLASGIFFLYRLHILPSVNSSYFYFLFLNIKNIHGG